MGKTMSPLFLGFLDRILFILAGNDNIHESLDEFEIGHIQPLVSMVTDRVMMKKRCLHFFSTVFHPILFILAGNDDMHESLDQFEFRP